MRLPFGQRRFEQIAVTFHPAVNLIFKLRGRQLEVAPSAFVLHVLQARLEVFL
jgi:hypothetical protein